MKPYPALLLIVCAACSTTIIQLPDTGADAEGDGDGDGDGDETGSEGVPDMPGGDGDPSGDGDGDGETSGDGDGDGDECPPQTEGCPCEGGGCGIALVCEDGICVPVNGDGDGDPGDGDGDVMLGPICQEAELINTDWGWDYYKVPVVGVMTDTNVQAACAACNLHVPCNGPDGCEYVDDVCESIMPEPECGQGLRQLANFMCGSMDPSVCVPLFGIYHYMGHAYPEDGSVAAEGASYPINGAQAMNRSALCVRDY